MSSELMKQMFLIQIDKSVTGPTVHQPKKTNSSEVSVEKCGDGSIVLWACFSSVETSRLQTEQEFHLSRMRPYVAQNRIIFGMPGQKKSLLEQVPDQTLFFFFFPWILKMYHFYISHLKPQLQTDVKFTICIHGPQRMNPLCCGHTMIILRSKYIS